VTISQGTARELFEGGKILQVHAFKSKYWGDRFSTWALIERKTLRTLEALPPTGPGGQAYAMTGAELWTLVRMGEELMLVLTEDKTGTQVPVTFHEGNHPFNEQLHGFDHPSKVPGLSDTLDAGVSYRFAFLGDLKPVDVEPPPEPADADEALET
jgi:hypothetical protein